MKQIITLRVEPELKDLIERKAQEEGITPSEYTRDILYDYLEYEMRDSNSEDNNSQSSEVHLYEISNIRKELPQLTLWLLILLHNSGYCNEKNVKIAKGFLENLTNDDTLSNDLRFELVKVLNNINLQLLEGISYNNLYFILPGNMYSLNYSLLFAEVYNLIGRDYAKGE